MTLYVIESLRERGRWQLEEICFSRGEARRRRSVLANEQTPHVRVVPFVRQERTP